MTATGVLMTIGFFVLVFKAIGLKEQGRQVPYEQGIMAKAIKATVGVGIGLVFFAFLYFVGWAVVLSAISNK